MKGKPNQDAVPGGVDVVAMPAKAGPADATGVGAAVLAALACGTAAVVADFSGTQFCDPAGIAELLTAARLAHANHIALRLVVPPNHVPKDAWPAP
jgi:hypothetical protein